MKRRVSGAGRGRLRNGVECNELKARSHGPCAKTVCALRTVAERRPRRAGTSIVARANPRAAVAQSVGALVRRSRERRCLPRVMSQARDEARVASRRSSAVRPA